MGISETDSRLATRANREHATRCYPVHREAGKRELAAGMLTGSRNAAAAPALVYPLQIYVYCLVKCGSFLSSRVSGSFTFARYSFWPFLFPG